MRRAPPTRLGKKSKSHRTLTVQAARLFPVHGNQFRDFSDHQFSVRFSTFARDRHGRAAVIRHVELMEIAEFDFQSHRFAAFYINVENASFIKVFGQSQATLNRDLAVFLLDPTFECRESN